jgi:hypothetical protein
MNPRHEWGTLDRGDASEEQPQILRLHNAVSASEVEAVAELGGEDSGVVEVEAADGDGVIEQHAVVGDV